MQLSNQRKAQFNIENMENIEDEILLGHNMDFKWT